MNLANCWARSLWLVAASAALAAGCASVEYCLPVGKDISHRRQQRLQAALGHFEQRRQRAELQAARIRWHQGDADGCTEILNRLLRRQPEQLEARLLMAEVLLTENRAAEAIGYLQPALRLWPQDGRVHHMMALLLDAVGRTSEALVHYQQAAKLGVETVVQPAGYETPPEVQRKPTGPQTDGKRQPPAPLPAGAHAARFSAGKQADRGHNWQALVVDCGSPDGADSADCAAGGGGLERAGHAEGVDSASVERLLEDGSAAMAAGMNDLALDCFRQAVGARPDDRQILIRAAVCALRHNQPAVAIRLLEPWQDVYDNWAALRRVLATAYYRAADYRSSQVALQQALSLDNSSALSYFLMGCTLIKLGQPEAAEPYFRQAGRLDPRYTVGR